ncbi:MAG: lipoprotein [Acidimicrobiales bacterium]|nr:lipoprotein [Acidimicrobiales bacterium]
MPAVPTSRHAVPAWHRSRTVRVALVGVALVLLAGCSKSAEAETSRATKTTKATKGSSTSTNRTVTVTATGSSKGVPDSMIVDVTITSGGASAAEVLHDNNARTHKVLDQLRMTAVDDKDVSTQSLDIGPTYDKKGKITGYIAHNSLEITFRSLNSAGTKLDYLVAGGDNHVRVGGFRLGFQDDDELVSTARIDAVKRAKAQAEQMAKAAGTDLGEARTITEVNVQNFSSRTALTTYDVGAQASSVPIAPGSQKLNVQVKVVFQLA